MKYQLNKYISEYDGLTSIVGTFGSSKTLLALELSKYIDWPIIYMTIHYNIDKLLSHFPHLIQGSNDVIPYNNLIDTNKIINYISNVHDTVMI